LPVAARMERAATWAFPRGFRTPPTRSRRRTQGVGTGHRARTWNNALRHQPNLQSCVFTRLRATSRRTVHCASGQAACLTLAFAQRAGVDSHRAMAYVRCVTMSTDHKVCQATCTRNDTQDRGNAGRNNEQTWKLTLGRRHQHTPRGKGRAVLDNKSVGRLLLTAACGAALGLGGLLDLAVLGTRPEFLKTGGNLPVLSPVLAFVGWPVLLR
jgi:hypothetical protein